MTAPYIGNRPATSEVLEVRGGNVLIPTREVRAPVAATQLTRYQAPDWKYTPEWDATNAIRWAYLANTFVYACVRARASDLASLPFRVGADPEKPADFDPKHPLALLLSPPPGGPNPVTSARRLFANAIASKIVTGRFAWELELRDGVGSVPTGFWPLAASRLDAFPESRPGKSAYWRRFEYGRSDAKKPLRPDQVFYSWRPSLDDWRQPESELQAARLDVSVAVMQDRYDYAFLRNDARPAAMVVHEAFAETNERDAFRAQFLAEHRGPENAGKPVFVETSEDGAEVGNAIDIKVLGLSQKDGEFIARYEAKIRAMCVALGVPMSRLMDASKRTFSNADRETVNYWVSTIVPDSVDLADDVNIQLAPRFGDNVGWFDTSGVAALVPASKFTAISVGDAYKARIATLNESRREVGLPEVDGGDEFVAFESLPSPVPIAPAQRERRQANTGGVIVALYPTGETAAALAVEGGETVEQLHCTLAYLGPDANDMPVTREAVMQLVATFAAAAPPVEATVAGLGRFEAGEEPVAVALIDAPALPEWRQRLLAVLEADGVPVDHTHGFTPHVTLRYGDIDDVEAPAGLEFTFETITLSWGLDRVDFALRGERAKPTAPRPIARPPETRDESVSETETPEQAELRRARQWRAVDAQMRTLETSWQRGMRSLFRRQEQTTIGRLESKRGRQMFRTLDAGETRSDPIDPGTLFDASFWTGETAAAVGDLYAAVLSVAGARVAAVFEIAFDVDAPYAVDFITARANQLAGQVTDTTYRAIQAELAEGVAAGEAIPQLATRIRKVFADASKNRAVTIARTEVVSAFNGSTQLVATQLPPGVVAGKEWIATRDSRVRDAHRSADGQTVDVAAPFVVDGEPLMYPGDPRGSSGNVINCRCTLALVAAPDAARSRATYRLAELALIRVARGELDPAAVPDFCREAA